MLSARLGRPAESPEAVVADGDGCVGHAHTEASEAFSEFRGIGRRHDEDRLANPYHPGSPDEALRSPNARFGLWGGRSTKDNLADSRCDRARGTRYIVGHKDPLAVVPFNGHRAYICVWPYNNLSPGAAKLLRSRWLHLGQEASYVSRASDA